MKRYLFVDRTGDTFRWCAEDVSTNEVGEILNAHPQITLSNVYGVEVPGVEGRADMVALAMGEGTQFDLAGFQSRVERSLPPYIPPAFVRIFRAVQTTVTFKLLKGELREQSYHLER